MEAPCHRTSLSTGIIVKALLSANPRLTAKATTLMAANSVSEVPLPFVRYWFEGISPTPVKGRGGYDTLTLTTVCYAETPEESLVLAELVRESLEGKCATWTEPEEGAEGLQLQGVAIAGFDQYLDGKAFANEVKYQMKVTSNNH